MYMISKSARNLCVVLFSKVDLLFLIPVISSTSSSDEDEEVGDDSDRELAQPPDAVKSGPERIHVRLWEEKHWVKGKKYGILLSYCMIHTVSGLNNEA